MKRIAVYFSCLNYQESNLKILRSKFNLQTFKNPNYLEDKYLKKTEVLFCPLGFVFDKKRIGVAENLKVLVSNTTGHPHIDIDYCKKRKIKVITLKNEKIFLNKITATPEFTFALILALTRNLIPAVKSVERGEWSRWNFGGDKMLSSYKIGIVGLGRIGKKVAEYSKAFGMEVFYYDPFVDNRKYKKCKTLKKLASLVDIFTIHIPHEKKTEGLINKEILCKMKKNSFLVNTARGEVINWSDLLLALKNKKIKGVALDVFENEFSENFKVNIKKNNFFKYAKKNKNVIITPHIGGSTRESWKLTEEKVIKETLNFFDL